MMKQTVVEMIAKQLKVPVEKVTDDARLVEDLKADSANIMVMIMDLEDQFGMMVEDDAIMNLKTVGDVITYIEAHK